MTEQHIQSSYIVLILYGKSNILFCQETIDAFRIISRLNLVNRFLFVSLNLGRLKENLLIISEKSF